MGWIFEALRYIFLSHPHLDQLQVSMHIKSRARGGVERAAALVVGIAMLHKASNEFLEWLRETNSTEAGAEEDTEGRRSMVPSGDDESRGGRQLWGHRTWEELEHFTWLLYDDRG